MAGIYGAIKRNRSTAIGANAYAFGDSISTYTQAHGSSSIANMWSSLFKAANAAYVWAETAQSGAEIYDMITNTVYNQAQFASGDLCVGLLAVNEMRFYPPTETFRFDEKQKISSYLAWMATPETLKTRAIVIGGATVNPAITITGTWANLGVSAVTAYNATQTVGDSVTLTLPKGDTIYIWLWKGQAYAGSVKVEVDGETVSTGGYYDSVNLSRTTFCPGFLRIDGLANTTHTLKITALVNNVPIIFQGAACFDSTFPLSTNVLVGNTLPMQGDSNIWGTAQYPVITGVGTVSSTGLTVTGAGSTFTQQVTVGSLIGPTSRSQMKTVTAVTNDTSLTTDMAFSPVLAAASSYVIVDPATQSVYQAGAARTYWSAIISEVVAMLYNDGFNVVLVDVNAFYDANGMCADLIHPNDFGHLLISRLMTRRFKDLINGYVK